MFRAFFRKYKLKPNGVSEGCSRGFAVSCNPKQQLFETLLRQGECQDVGPVGAGAIKWAGAAGLHSPALDPPFR
jgi:hypothetical protein